MTTMTGAFLAEWADVVDDKLQVSGAVLSAVAVGADRSVDIVIVVLTHADEAAASSAGRHAKSADGEQLSEMIQLEVKLPTGEVSAHNLELPSDLADSEVGCAFFPLGLQLLHDGRHEIVLTLNQVRIPLPLTVSAAT